MPERFKDINLLELTVTIFFMFVSFWPWIKDTWNPHAKTIDEDLKGDDGKWQANELRARASFGRFCAFCAPLENVPFCFYL